MTHKYPEFVDNSDYIGMDSSVPETEQLKAMLTNLTRIHLLTANKFDSFDELIHEYIISGIEVFGLETGIVSEIHDNTYKVCDVVSPISALHKGMEFPLEDTYCKEVFTSLKVIGFPEVGKLEYMNCHPVYENLQLEAYLSAPIYVGEKLFGTFNFTSTTARSKGFSKHEHDLILLMANSIGAFILLRQKEEKLKELNNKMKRFLGYVAHDLRNPLGAIINYSKLGTKPTTSQDRIKTIIARIGIQAEQALSLVSDILQAAALSAGKITLDKASVNLAHLLQPSLESVLLFAQDSDITFDIEGDVAAVVFCDINRIQQSLNNLLINAIKYSPKGSLVRISVSSSHGECKISIVNPVAPKKETLSDEKKAIYGSIGFGLDIVSEVMDAHETQVTQSEKNGIYTVSFCLPIALTGTSPDFSPVG